jgi:pantoate--beta-alanine ligase
MARQENRELRVLTTAAELREAVLDLRRAGRTIGLVPTMGALHAGHLSLVQASRAQCDVTLATIFVNPTQFAPHEDFGKYPRTFDADRRALADCGADLLFAPAEGEVYPPGFSTYVEPPAVAAPLEGQCRPGHFRGVATVVLKLFLLSGADVAFFGRKDYQQALVIQHLVRDLDVPVRICVCPIVREPDGLAMSSRNRYLRAEERRRATALWQALSWAAERVAAGERDVERLTARMRAVLEENGLARIDYVTVADPHTLRPVQTIQAPAVALIAAHLGNTRLIDNILLQP